MRTSIYFVGDNKVDAIDRGPFKYYGAAADYQVDHPDMVIYEINFVPSALKVCCG